MSKIQAIKGTYDILPGDVESWQEMERVVREVMDVFGFNEIRTPVFEDTSLFARSIGEDTDIVGKEMYTFIDKGNRSLTLRPEGTASVVRSFIEHAMDQRGLPQKLWYMGPMFRQERPQKGRQRQFHQFGVEVIGSSSAMADVEVIVLFDAISLRLGLDNRTFAINSIGGDESRLRYRDALVSFLDIIEDRLCEDCRRRKTTNPLRVLDCKVPGCREAVHGSGDLPRTVDYLTENDSDHFEKVQELLTAQSISYTCDYTLVRGLDYYTGTVFEMHYEGLGAQSAVMGGGRYDRLVGQLGGKDYPAVGFACGMERLVMAMNTAKPSKAGRNVQVYVVNALEDSSVRAMRYLQAIRNAGYAADMDFMGRSMKAQLKSASRSGAMFAVIIEPEEDMVSVRDMEKSEQNTMSFREFIQIMGKGEL